jgi:hypothetical protein
MIESVRSPSASARSRRHIAVLAVLVVLAGAYLVQLASPLRLDTDSASYLRIAASIADGHGTHPPDTPSFPPGYPSLVAGLDLAGLGTPAGLVALNLAFLAVGLGSLFVALRHGLGLGETASTVVCVLTLLSSAVAKHAVIPLSEIVFFGLVAASVAALTVALADGRSPLLVAGILLALAACTVRTAGIGLAPAVILAFRSTRSRVVAAVTVAVAATAAAATTPRYLDELSRGWDNGVLRSALTEAHDLLELVGAAVANVPQSKLDTVSPLLVAVGAITLPLVAIVLFLRRRQLGPVDGWVVGALVVLYVWPSDVARFMLPVFPYLLGYGALAARRWNGIAIAYAAAFAALGLAAITLSTRLTFSGCAFPERYASGVLAPTYRVAWGRARPGDRARVEPAVLEMLRRYEPEPPCGRPGATAARTAATNASTLGP